jgi:hypothetical protein
MKELGLTTEEKYLQVRREGRGGREGKALNKQVRKKIFPSISSLSRSSL